jgi:GT2 family glycosyltransferase
MDFSIVIVSHNQRNLLERYLPSFFNVPTTAAFEIALVDNACSDGSAEWVSNNFPQVRIIRNEVPKSYAENMNRGMREMMNGRYFVVCNPDVEVLPGLWDEAVKFMDKNHDVGIMGPKLLNRDMTVQMSCRRFSSPIILLIRGLRLDALLKNIMIIHQYLMIDYDHATVRDVDWVTGALMIVRREAIAQIGKMDERYKIAYSEDQDWCCRMWRGNWRVCYLPQAKAIHDHQQKGMRRPLSKMGRIQLMNNIRLFNKFGWKLSRKFFMT